MPSRRSRQTEAPTADVDAHVQLAKATWPRIDADVEAIVIRIARAADLLDQTTRANLQHVGLTKEEFKVICTLHSGPRSHRSLCEALAVTTGTMTNRLDKLERLGLVERSANPTDRRGVQLNLTNKGQEKLNAYIELGATREIALLSPLTTSDKQHLNELLDKLLQSLNADLDR